MSLINTEGLALIGPGSEWFWTAYYQHREDAIPTEYWVGAEAYYRNLVATNPGYTRFWSDNRISFEEPFRSCAAPRAHQEPGSGGFTDRGGSGLTLSRRAG